MTPPMAGPTTTTQTEPAPIDPAQAELADFVSVVLAEMEGNENAVVCFSNADFVENFVEEISDEMAGKVKVVKINVDENPGVPGKMGIRSIPTLMLFKHGKLASQKVGSAPKNALAKWIQNEIK